MSFVWGWGPALVGIVTFFSFVCQVFFVHLFIRMSDPVTRSGSFFYPGFTFFSSALFFNPGTGIGSPLLPSRFTGNFRTGPCVSPDVQHDRILAYGYRSLLRTFFISAGYAIRLFFPECRFAPG